MDRARLYRIIKMTQVCIIITKVIHVFITDFNRAICIFICTSPPESRFLSLKICLLQHFIDQICGNVGLQHLQAGLRLAHL